MIKLKCIKNISADNVAIDNFFRTIQTNRKSSQNVENETKKSH